MKSLDYLISSNNRHNNKFDNFSRNSNQKSKGAWSHDGYKQETGIEREDAEEDVEMEEERETPWMAVLSNLHWEILEADLMELFGFYNFANQRKQYVESCTLSWDNAGRSLGIASLVFKNEALAYDAQRKFNGQILEGRELIVEVKGPYRRRKKLIKKKNSIASRLGPKTDVFSRLAPKIEDRLGKKLDDRLGNKSNSPSIYKKKLPIKNLRKIRSYADAEVAEMDGQMI